MKLTQKNIVKRQILEAGFVSRNWSIRQNIYRLAAIVQVLEREGFDLIGEDADGDYRYRLVSQPPPKPRYEYVERIIEGRITRVPVLTN